MEVTPQTVVLRDGINIQMDTSVGVLFVVHAPHCLLPTSTVDLSATPNKGGL